MKYFFLFFVFLLHTRRNVQLVLNILGTEQIVVSFTMSNMVREEYLAIPLNVT